MFTLAPRGFTAATLEAARVTDGGAGKEAALVAATKELERSFNKADFKNMKVIFYSSCMVANGRLIGLSSGLLYVGSFSLRSDQSA